MGRAALPDHPSPEAGARPQGGLQTAVASLKLTNMYRLIQESGVTILTAGPSYTGLEEEALQEFGEVLLSEVSHATPPRFVIDMSETDFIGSSFIEILVRAWKRVKNRNGTMALCGLHPFCHEVLQISRLDTIWPICASRDQAMSAV